MREAHPQRLKYRGIFDLDGFLRTVRQWMIDRGYEFHEKNVKYKVPSPAGAELEMEWEAWLKVTAYVKFWIKVGYHMFDVKEVEVIKDGKKQKLTSARMLMEIWGQVDLDYTNRFKGSRFAEALQDFYHKYVIRKDLDNIWEDELYYRVYKLYSVAKQYLEMEAAHNAAELRW
jgi:hypothetical protein